MQRITNVGGGGGVRESMRAIDTKRNIEGEGEGRFVLIVRGIDISLGSDPSAWRTQLMQGGITVCLPSSIKNFARLVYFICDFMCEKSFFTHDVLSISIHYYLLLQNIAPPLPLHPRTEQCLHLFRALCLDLWS